MALMISGSITGAIVCIFVNSYIVCCVMFCASILHNYFVVVCAGCRSHNVVCTLVTIARVTSACSDLCFYEPVESS